MPVRNLSDGSYSFFTLDLTVEEIPTRLKLVEKYYIEAVEIEKTAIQLATDNFPPCAAAAFIEATCRWGRSHYVWPNFRRLNTSDEFISKQLSSAQRALDESNIVGALRQILSLKGLGVSFSSKVLRMMAPLHAATLDSVIGTKMGYSMDSNGQGYGHFISDCQVILGALRAKNIEHPFSTRVDSWRICDVEMAIYNKLNPRT